MREEQITAFHESGHARIAHSFDPLSVLEVSIFQQDHRWQGHADISLGNMHARQRTAVAIAGMLTEARAAIIERTNDPDSRISTGSQLAAEVGRVIGIAIENRLESVDANIPCEVFPSARAFIPSRLTLEDIRFIPDEIAGNDVLIRDAATDVCQLVNSPTEWATFQRLAEALVQNAPNPIPNFLDIIGAE